MRAMPFPPQRVSHRLCEEDALLSGQLQFRGEFGPVTVMKPSRETDGSGEYIDVGGDEASVHVVVRALDIGIAKARLLVPRRVGKLVGVDDVNEPNGCIGTGAPLPGSNRERPNVLR